MKKIITSIVITLSAISLISQIDTSTTIFNKIDTTQHLMLKAGSCGSPDGSILEAMGPPASWQELSDNGYCYAGINSTNSVTMCFTFTPSVSNILLNGGYSESCANNNFTAFNVYDNSCSFVTTSLNPTTLTAGQQYTWCVTMKAWGGGSCTGYTTFCPYWINNNPLPVELIEFKGYNKDEVNHLYWIIASEFNNEYFYIEKSSDGENWEYLGEIEGEGVTNVAKIYDFKDLEYNNTLNYYQLTQVDFDGNPKTFSPIVINNTRDNVELDKIINLMGQEVAESYVGLKFYLYKNGDVKKLIKI